MCAAGHKSGEWRGKELGSSLNATGMFCKGHAYLLAASNSTPHAPPFPFLNPESVCLLPGRPKVGLQIDSPNRAMCCAPPSHHSRLVMWSSSWDQWWLCILSSSLPWLPPLQFPCLQLNCAEFPSYHQTLISLSWKINALCIKCKSKTFCYRSSH